MTDVTLWSRYHEDPGCLQSSYSQVEDAHLLTAASSQEVLVVRILHKDYRWMQVDPSQNGAETRELAYACHVDAKGAAACEAPLLTARAKQPLPTPFDPGAKYVIDVDKTPWIFRKEPILGPAGDLRLSP